MRGVTLAEGSDRQNPANSETGIKGPVPIICEIIG
jgi:hypothetical protein